MSTQQFDFGPKACFCDLCDTEIKESAREFGDNPTDVLVGFSLGWCEDDIVVCQIDTNAQKHICLPCLKKLKAIHLG